MPARHFAAVVAGNVLEFYDFTTYAYFAIYIGRTFFPQGAQSGLLLSLATFGVGFLTRPLGAVIIGRMGDRAGRKPAMMLSFGLMGIAVIGMALTPSYARIGGAAPALLLMFRLVQGFALGGEVGPTTAYMIEAAPRERRGLYATMQTASQQVANLMAGVIGTVLAATLDAEQMQDWGWRLAMLVGAIILPFGLLIRRSLPETLTEGKPAAAGPMPSIERTGHRRLIVLGFMMLIPSTVGIYVGIYLTTYALSTLQFSATASFGVVVVNSLTSIAFQILSGVLSDRFGRKPVMIIPGVALLASIVPAFWIIVQFHSVTGFYLCVTWLAMLRSLSNGPVLPAITESLPRWIRSGVVAMVYALAISLFGGSTGFIVDWLIHRTENPLIPAFYWMAAAAIGLVAMVMIPESAPGRKALSLDGVGLGGGDAGRTKGGA